MHNERIHQEEFKSQHQCEICSHFFNTKKDLDQHIKYIHDKIKDAHCEICGKEFGRKGDLKKHIMSIHEGIKK